MGTTVRRQPVNFDIPKSPDYKFLNITNFRGLDVSSNPFELASNTASDCLNVYVDETNTLTTRPRLEKKADALIEGTHIGTYNLHNGYLLHYLQDGVGVLATWIDNVITQITGKDLTPDQTDASLKQYYTIPTVKCQYFEQDDKIYLLDGERYMVIVDNVLSEVEGYVPTTSVVDAVGNKHDVEPLNLLTTNYEEKYIWDGVSSVSLPEKPMDATNAYYTKFNTLPGTLIHLYNDNSAIVMLSGSKIQYIPNVLAESVTTYDIVNFRESPWTDSWLELYRLSYAGDEQDSKKVFCVLDTFKNKFVIFTRIADDNWSSEEFSLDVLSGEILVLSRRISVARCGEIFSFEHDELKSSGNSVSVTTTLVKNPSSLKYVVANVSYNTIPVGSRYLSDANDLVLLVRSANDFVSAQVLHIKINFEKTSDTTKITTTETVVHDYSASNAWFVRVSKSGDTLSVGGRDWLDIYDKKDGSFAYDTRTHRPFPNDVFIQRFDVDENSKTAYAINLIPSEGVSDLYVTENYYTHDFKNTYLKALPDDTAYRAGKFYLQNSIVYVWNPEGSIVDKRTLINDSEWMEKRTRLLKSLLTTRFDNNYWFTEGNRYYRSQNNDPTYFPITEYNDLGDGNESITGFNLANDTTLLAYKSNRLYLIQPFTSSLDTREYTITESKNTVGNTAIGAPIVTTLTEIPLQINNDGIYGLSQLQNVSATERIADLMSEPINERWLKLDDSLVKKTMTLNRLYWTYVIIPDELAQRTIVYLLDNRTNSWYYWELPIVAKSAFVKDNVVEFVTTSGVIYYLTTQDIVDKNYDDQIVTKYYDYGGKLIKWYWQSQILPLGTMNYAKRLVNTTFILTDTDDNDGYGLRYSFKVFRKLASSVPEKEITDKLTLVRSTTRKTNVSKFGFIQLRLDNLTEESRDYEAYENNKLRLVGLGLKYVLLEGLIR